jgi:5-methyltetrahydrofolate--homocysteine methyltransferase
VEKAERLQKLAQAVLEMDLEGIVPLVEDSLAAGLSPVEILAEGLSAGMRQVGERFKQGEIFMPEVLVSCDVYYRGLEILRPLIRQTGGGPVRGKMIIGTIYGDIHSVGKDVAVPVFQAAGYDVIDLGVDVPDERFVEAIREYEPDIVGLGTYMTSTFMHTRETVRVIEQAGLRDRVKIICGGPAVDPAAARRMGADDASDDAWEAVGKLDRLVEELRAARRSV